MKLYWNYFIILAGFCLEYCILLAAHQWHRILANMAHAALLFAVACIIASLSAVFLKSSSLAIICSVAMTEFAFALGVLAPIAYGANVNKHAIEMGPLIATIAVIYSMPMVVIVSFGLVRLVKCSRE